MSLQRLWLAVLVVASTQAASRASEPAAIKADLVLRGGTLVDGSGAEGAVGDLAIHAGKIVGVGKFEVESAGREIDFSLQTIRTLIDDGMQAGRRALQKYTKGEGSGEASGKGSGEASVTTETARGSPRKVRGSASTSTLRAV